MLRYYGWLRSITVDEQAKQYECANSIAARGVPGGKMISALTLIVPDAPFADFARAWHDCETAAVVKPVLTME